MLDPTDSPLIPDKFSFFVPLTKAYTQEEANGGDPEFIVEGIVSNGGEDQEGDAILPEGADYSYLLDRGFLKWEHGNRPDQFIGEPMEARVTKEGLFVRFRLYPHMELARKAVEAIRNLKLSNAKRRMGFSIEGSVVKRDESNPQKILKAIIRNVVLTMNPVNQYTWADLAKSFSGLDSLEFSFDDATEKSLTLDAGAAIRPQDIEGVPSKFDDEDFIKRMRRMFKAYLRKHAKVRKSLLAMTPDQMAQDCFDYAVDQGMSHDEADELASYLSERAGIVKSIFAGGVSMGKALAFLDDDLEALAKSLGTTDVLQKSMGDEDEDDEDYEEENNDGGDNDGDDNEEDNDNKDADEEDGDGDEEDDDTEKSFDVTEWLDGFVGDLKGGFEELSKSLGTMSSQQQQMGRVLIGLGRALQEQQKEITSLRKSLKMQAQATEELANQPRGRKSVVDPRERRTLNKSMGSEGTEGRQLTKGQISDELFKSWEKGDIHEDVVATFESRGFLDPAVAEKLNIAWRNPTA